jgi:hypothetical protein
MTFVMAYDVFQSSGVIVTDDQMKVLRHTTTSVFVKALAADAITHTVKDYQFIRHLGEKISLPNGCKRNEVKLLLL